MTLGLNSNNDDNGYNSNNNNNDYLPLLLRLWWTNYCSYIMSFHNQRILGRHMLVFSVYSCGGYIDCSKARASKYLNSGLPAHKSTLFLWPHATFTSPKLRWIGGLWSMALLTMILQTPYIHTLCCVTLELLLVKKQNLFSHPTPFDLVWPFDLLWPIRWGRGDSMLVALSPGFH